jgi:uncharacterized membrane protein
MPDDLDAKTPKERAKTAKTKRSTAMQFLWKGLAISLPPVLTLVILIWIGQGVYGYIIRPINNLMRVTIAQFIDKSQPIESLQTMPGLPRLDYYERKYYITPELKLILEASLRNQGEIQTEQSAEGQPALRVDRPDAGAISLRSLSNEDDRIFIPVGVGEPLRAVPYEDYRIVAQNVAPADIPHTVTGLYMEVVTHGYFLGLFHLSAIAVILTIILLYFIGRLMTARLGGWLVGKFETVFLARLPLISNVYSSVKQVTDFVFSERTVEYNRVVAIEYPRRGIWSIGFVTGDSMLEMTAAAGEPLVSVLVPTSPMPVTGYTMSIPRSDVMDLDITIDQAFQFTVSCGVLVPEQQHVTPELLQQEIAKRLSLDVDVQPVRRSGLPTVTKTPLSQQPDENQSEAAGGHQADRSENPGAAEDTEGTS